MPSSAPASVETRQPVASSLRTRNRSAIARSWAMAVLFIAVAFPATGAEEGRVLEVVDGDTIKVELPAGPATVRLIGIDAPERSHPSKRKEFFSDESAAKLEALVLGRKVRLESDLEDVDKYGRLLRYVAIPGPPDRSVNIEMLKAGAARVYRRFPFSRRAQFEEAELEAEVLELGVWSGNGMAELLHARKGGGGAVEVWPLGGGDYGLAFAGMGKTGVAPKELQQEIAHIVRLRGEDSDSDFASDAMKDGWVSIDGPPSPVTPTAPADTSPAPAPVTAVTADASKKEPPLPPGVVSWEKAHEFVGRTITVEGTVVRAKKTRKAFFINFHTNWKKYVTIVVFPSDHKGLFPTDPKHWEGKRIRVKGLVKKYKDRPEIVLKDRRNLTVVPKK